MAYRRNKHTHVTLESKVHRIWREESTGFHQNMFESFSAGPNKLGYHVVKNGDNLKKKIKIAIFGCDSDTEPKLNENGNKMIDNFAERIVKYSPEIYSKNNLSVMAIIYVYVLLNDENAEIQKYALFRVPKLVENKKYEDEDEYEDEYGEKKKEKVNFTSDGVEVEYPSGEKTVYDLNECDAHYFIGGTLRVYSSWEDYKANNKLPIGKMCAPKDGVYKGDEGGRVQVEIVETPARANQDGTLQLWDASSSLLGKVATGLWLASAFTQVGVVGLSALACLTATSTYSCTRNVVELVDRHVYDQELSLHDEDARHLWIDTVLSGAVTVAGCRLMAEGCLALLGAEGVLHSILHTSATSSILAAVWTRNSTWVIATSVTGLLQMVLTRIIDRFVFGDWHWSDLFSLKKVFGVFLKIFSPIKLFKNTFTEIVTITKPIFKIASSVAHYLQWSFDKLTTAIAASAAYLMLDIASISGKFLFNVSVGLLDKRFKLMHDTFKDFFCGRITLVNFALEIAKHSGDVFSWFSESLNNAKQEYRQLRAYRKAEHILEIDGMENVENLRKMFQELDDVLKSCKVDKKDENDNKNNKQMEGILILVKNDNKNNKQMESLIILVDKFRSKLVANCNVNEFLFSVTVVCASVKKCWKEKMNEYEKEFNFNKDVRDDFNEDEFNKQFGLTPGAEGHVDPATHFFAESVASLHTDDELAKMLEIYGKKAADSANKSIPSIQSTGINQYLFVNPAEVTDISKDSMWQELFKAQTGIAIDKKNVQMERVKGKDKNIILIRPKSNDLKFKLAFFSILEETPELKGILCVCTSLKED